MKEQTDTRENIVNDIIEAERAIKRSDEYINDLYVKIKNLEDAIETIENENIALPESVYGALAYYKSEYDKEIKANEHLIKEIENTKKKINYSLEDKARYISSHGGKYTWVSNGHLVDDDGIVFD